MLEISNRSLMILLGVTVSLVLAAVLLTLVGRRTDSNLDVQASNDYRIMPVVTRAGGARPEASVDPLVVHLRADATAMAATLTCTQVETQRQFVEGEVYWEQVPADGNCKLLLAGTKTPYGPVFKGDQLECGANGDVTACTGGLASLGAATVSVASALPGVLEVDGVDIGRLPVERTQFEVGKRELVVRLDDGRILRWTLNVQPNEQIGISFPSPDAPASASN